MQTLIEETAANTAIELQPNGCTCPVCGGTHSVDFFRESGLPVHVGIFGSTREEARSLPTGDVALSYCPDCDFVHNRLFDPTLRAYGPGYEVALHHSPVFREFLSGVADRLTDRFDLHDKDIVEIGCGDGYFLSLLADTGVNRCVGHDPSAPDRPVREPSRGSVSLVSEYFGEESEASAEFLCCLSVFEHIPAPADFLRLLRKKLELSKAGVYFEVFNAGGAIERRDIWSIHYEQVNYFSARSLKTLFEVAGFEVLDVNTCYSGDQYLFVEATPGTINANTINKSSEPVSIPSAICEFAAQHHARSEFWNETLAEYRRLGKRVVLWGSGGKGITFLNSQEQTDVIEHVVEINPAKHGLFIPGSGQQIWSPEFLAEYQPDVVIITNALYRDEMTKQARELGVECEFVVA